MGGRDHSCECCGRGGFNDPWGQCVCAPCCERLAKVEAERNAAERGAGGESVRHGSTQETGRSVNRSTSDPSLGGSQSRPGYYAAVAQLQGRAESAEQEVERLRERIQTARQRIDDGERWDHVDSALASALAPPAKREEADDG